MTITVTYAGQKFEWDAMRPVWTSAAGNVIRSQRLIAKLEREARAVLEREFTATEVE